jgi:hypothetical protein
MVFTEIGVPPLIWTLAQAEAVQARQKMRAETSAD